MISHCHSPTLAVWLGVLLVVPSATGADAVATVGDQIITPEKLRQIMARQGYNVFEMDSAKKALEDALNTEVLAAAARQLAYDRDPEIADRIKQLLVEKFVQDKVDKPVQATQPSDEELKVYFDSHHVEFSQPGLAKAQLLTFMTHEGQTNEALSRAQAALAAIKGGKSFEEVAAKESDDPSERVSKAAPTWFTEGSPNRRYPEPVLAAIFQSSHPGELTGPIVTPRAAYLVKLVEKRPVTARSFTESRAAVLRAVLHDKRQKAYADLCAKLRQDIPVRVDESQLLKAIEKSSPGAGPPKGPAGN